MHAHSASAARCVPLDDATRAEIMAANDDYARNALRVLALARRELPPSPRSNGGAAYTPERVERDLTFLGLLAMMDPPRPEVAAAVKTCRSAGHSHGDDHRRLRPHRRIGGAARRHAHHAAPAHPHRRRAGRDGRRRLAARRWTKK